jgi:hypothetical protein
MSATLPTPPPVGRPHPTFAWWAVLCLVGLDYFSSLAYLPSLALKGSPGLAALAGVGVAAITLLVALPIYLYVVGRSPHGEGGTGLLERRVYGWGGKFLILLVLGFIATDFVVTRSLSVADASVHLLANPVWKEHSTWFTENRDTVRTWFPSALQGQFFDFWNEQLILTLFLSILAFGLYFFLIDRMSRGFLSLAVTVVAVYLGLTAIIVASGLHHLSTHPELLEALQKQVSQWEPLGQGGSVGMGLGLLALLSFPPLAIGLSGFELSMASAPLVRGSPSDTPDHPRGRILRTRMLLIVAAIVMSVFVIGSVLVVSALVKPADLEVDGVMQHRALAYLAHDKDSALSPLFGPVFGTLYDLSTVMMLSLAGAAATISMRDLVPHFLSKFGMELRWAHKVGVIIHLFNVLILVVTVVFQASVDAQQGAYATSVLALLCTASLAGAIDVQARREGSLLGWLLSVPFWLATVLFLVMGVFIVVRNPSGVAIALVFVGVVFGSAAVSRWMRSTELRSQDFAFADEETRRRWEEMCQIDFQVLVPHQPGGRLTLSEKEVEVRRNHRLGPDVPILFVEVFLGDPSDFYQEPLMKIEQSDGREVIRVSHCTSVAHAITAIGLAFCRVGQPPEIHFAWSSKSTHHANLDFILFGQGNVPWLVRELINKAERDPGRRPRIIVA